MFVLTSENLTCLGGPMGTERTFNNYEKYFNDLCNAMAYAEKEYGKRLEWIQEKEKHLLRTKDLGYVMYYVHEMKTED